MEKSCSNCRFAKQLSGVSRLICRRYPPSTRVEGHSHDSYYFPTVNVDEWCGEYEPLEHGKSGPADAASGGGADSIDVEALKEKAKQAAEAAKTAKSLLEAESQNAKELAEAAKDGDEKKISKAEAAAQRMKVLKEEHEKLASRALRLAETAKTIREEQQNSAESAKNKPDAAQPSENPEAAVAAKKD